MVLTMLLSVFNGKKVLVKRRLSHLIYETFSTEILHTTFPEDLDLRKMAIKNNGSLFVHLRPQTHRLTKFLLSILDRAASPAEPLI